nr:syndecan-1-like [Labrus bergylta]
MRTPLTACFCIALVFIYPAHTSVSGTPEDLEGSGYDLDSSASGSGDWLEDGEDEVNEEVRTLTEILDDGAKNPSHGSSFMTFDKSQWPPKDSYVILANRKSLLENQEVVGGVIAGGVTGLILAATVAAVLIYKWWKKDDERYTLGQHRASDEYYHRQSRDEIVVV